jgi:hypothetical protein
MHNFDFLSFCEFLFGSKLGAERYTGEIKTPSKKTLFFRCKAQALQGWRILQSLDAVYTLYVNPTKILQKIFPFRALAKKKQKGNT